MIDSANDFFNDLLDDSKSMNVAKFGKVVKFYPEQMKIDVLPYPTEDRAIILNVPVATVRNKDYVIYYPLKPDDIVLLLFIDNDTDKILMGEDDIQSERMHDENDCVALGGITLLNDNLNITNTDDIVIQNISGNGSISLSKDGTIALKGKATYNGREIACIGDGTSDGATITG